MKDCLVHIGTCIAPVGNAKSTGELVAQIQIEYADGKEEEFNLLYGDLLVLPLKGSKRLALLCVHLENLIWAQVKEKWFVRR